jgi:drug/metabolite transporter (DMT)-like permease
MVVGVLIHASFLFGVFSAIEQNLPAGVVSLVMGLQPILTAVLAFLWLNASIKATQWLGLFLGLAGVALVVSTQGRDISQAIAVTGWLTVIFGLVAISVGTLYQKRFGGEIDPMVGAFFQYLAAAIVCGIGTVAIGDFDFQINATVIGAMLWMVFGLSVTAILLLMIMIRQNESTRVASYFYLTPPLTAIQAWALFGESLSFLAIIGFVVVLIGVFLTTRSQ